MSLYKYAYNDHYYWWSFCKAGTVDTLASQAEIGGVGPRTGGAWYHPSPVRKNVSLYMQSSAVLCILGQKMVCNAVRNAFLNTMGTPSKWTLVGTKAVKMFCDSRHFAGTTEGREGNDWKEESIGDCQKTRRGAGADVTWRGSSLRTRAAAATGKARSPTVDSRVRRWALSLNFSNYVFLNEWLIPNYWWL